MIDWNKYFDHIYILTRCSSFDRRKICESELHRIGLYNYHWWYNCDNELMNYDKIINNYGKGTQRAAYGHYTLIKTLYELNYDNVLIMEDDNCFLNDINKIQEQLDIFLSNKNNCDEYYFDYVINNNSITFHNCHYINRRMMKYYIYNMEHYGLINDNYVPIYFLSPNDYIEFSYTYMYNTIDDDETKYKYIKIPREEHLLPIQVILSPIRICVQPDKLYLYSEVTTQNKLENLNDYNICKS